MEVSTSFGTFTSGKTVFYIQNSDVDNDGVEDYRVVETHGSSPLLNDSDADTLSYYLEIFEYHTNSMPADSDSDDLDDALEIVIGTNPLQPDSDRDGLEYALESAPLDPESNIETLTGTQLMLAGNLGTVVVVIVLDFVLRRRT